MAINMALARVNDEEAGDLRCKPRWSAGLRIDIVLPLLRRDNLSRELGFGADHIPAWRDEYPA
jgi:hypothetical protein